MNNLKSMPNIADKLEAQLMEAGITTSDQLKNMGSREAWLRIFNKDPSVCLLRLYALEGAVQGIRWHNLDDQTKSSLKEFYCFSKKDAFHLL